MPDKQYGIADLLQLMQRLRDPDIGCPWDLAQTYASIVPSTLEECYELAEAIESEDFEHMREELGDVLFQVVFYTQLAAEEDRFEFNDVVDGLVSKLVRRHPHVFADGTLDSLPPARAHTTDEIRETWERIKREERTGKDKSGTLADVPVNLPALTRAQKIQKRAATTGFDWPNTEGVIGKLEEEIGELHEAIASGDRGAMLTELGDVLFTCVNLCRHLDADAEALLRATTARFEQRFTAMEAELQKHGVTLEQADAAVMDAAWNRIKRAE